LQNYVYAGGREGGKRKEDVGRKVEVAEHFSERRRRIRMRKRRGRFERAVKISARCRKERCQRETRVQGEAPASRMTRYP